MKRGCGVLLPISSLPNRYGFGCFSKEAYEFVDYLAELGAKYWQVLPLGPVDEVGSPYSSVSAFAGEPLYIDLDCILDKGKIGSFELSNKLEFAEYKDRKMKALRYCFENQKEKINIEKFKENNKNWIYNYALYMALQDYFGVGYSRFPDEYKDSKGDAVDEFKQKNKREIEFYIYLEYLFFEQWEKLKNYANEKQIKIIGDVPIYCAMDSVEMFSQKEIFMLDGKGKPAYISGVPGDYFNPEGQLWNNPLYNYKAMEKNHFAWWVSRMQHLSKIYDYVRIDHFRGFESFFAIPYGDTTVENGKWIEGPGMKIFEEFYAHKIKNLILEDLGIISKAVIALRKMTGLAGMKVVQFAFDDDPNNLNLPHLYEENSVSYLGTHDNDTFMGFLTDENEKRRVCGYYNIPVDTPNETVTKIAIDNLLSTNSVVCVLTMQDILFQGSESRINTPGTTEGNWIYRLPLNYKSNEFSEYLKELIKIKNR